MDWGYVSRGIEKTQKTLIEKASVKRYWVAIKTAVKLVSSSI